MVKIKFIGTGTNFIDKDMLNTVHIVDETGDGEYTLCGYAYTDEKQEETEQKVSCLRCIKMVKDLTRLIKIYKKEVK